MLAVDTNVLFRILVRDDTSQQAASDAFVVPGAWVSHLVLAEAVWVLGSVFGRSHVDLIDALGLLLSHDHIVIEAPDVVSSALENYKKKPSLRFTDCLILEIARKAGHLPLGTFDRGLAKLADTYKL